MCFNSISHWVSRSTETNDSWKLTITPKYAICLFVFYIKIAFFLTCHVFWSNITKFSDRRRKLTRGSEVIHSIFPQISDLFILFNWKKNLLNICMRFDPLSRQVPRSTETNDSWKWRHSLDVLLLMMLLLLSLTMVVVVRAGVYLTFEPCAAT